METMISWIVKMIGRLLLWALHDGLDARVRAREIGAVEECREDRYRQ